MIIRRTPPFPAAPATPTAPFTPNTLPEHTGDTYSMSNRPWRTAYITASMRECS